MLRSYDELLQKKERAILRISAIDAATNFWLPQVLNDSQFVQKNPKIDIAIETKEWWDILQDLRTGAAALGISHFVDDRTLKEKVRFTRPHLAIIPESNEALRSKQSLSYTDLGGQILLCLRSYVATIDMEFELEVRSIDAQIIRLATCAQIWSFLREKLGIAFLPVDMIQDRTGLRIIPFVDPLPNADDAVFLSHKPGRLSQHAEQLAQDIWQYWKTFDTEGSGYVTTPEASAPIGDATPPK
jgi:DNA-binding transcriptional LysR family regulator